MAEKYLQQLQLPFDYIFDIDVRAKKFCHRHFCRQRHSTIQDIYLTVVNNERIVKVRIHPLMRSNSENGERIEKLRFSNLIEIFLKLVRNDERVINTFPGHALSVVILLLAS